MRSHATCHPDRELVGRGLCRTCYSREYMRANKQYAQRKLQADCHPDRKNAGKGLCASCYQMDWTRRHPGRRYGLTDQEYDKLMTDHEGVCAICLSACRTKGRLSIDHDHKTGAVRGLLCDDCNNGVGKFKDDVELLSRAVQYLQRPPTGIHMNPRLKAVGSHH